LARQLGVATELDWVSWTAEGWTQAWALKWATATDPERVRPKEWMMGSWMEERWAQARASEWAAESGSLKGLGVAENWASAWV
jgi:hypothetical protein